MLYVVYIFDILSTGMYNVQCFTMFDVIGILLISLKPKSNIFVCSIYVFISISIFMQWIIIIHVAYSIWRCEILHEVLFILQTFANRKCITTFIGLNFWFHIPDISRNNRHRPPNPVFFVHRGFDINMGLANIHSDEWNGSVVHTLRFGFVLLLYFIYLFLRNVYSSTSCSRYFISNFIPTIYIIFIFIIVDMLSSCIKWIQFMDK